jgi:hypothetical protein
MKRNIDTDPSIEQRLFSSASQVEVKTTSAQILKAYQAKPQEKKDMIESSSPLYTKLWVKIALPLGCTACACAIGLGTYFGTLPKTVSEDVPLLTNVSSKLLYEVNTATPFILAEADGGQTALASQLSTSARSLVRQAPRLESGDGDSGQGPWWDNDDNDNEGGWDDGFGDPHEGFGPNQPHPGDNQQDNAALDDIALTYQYLNSKMVTISSDSDPTFDVTSYSYDNASFDYVYKDKKNRYSYYLDHDPKATSKESFSGVYVTPAKSFLTQGKLENQTHVHLSMNLTSTLGLVIQEKTGLISSDNSRFVFTETQGTKTIVFESETDNHSTSKQRGTLIHIGKTVSVAGAVTSSYTYSAREDEDHSYAISYTRTTGTTTLSGTMIRSHKDNGQTVFKFEDQDYKYYI